MDNQFKKNSKNSKALLNTFEGAIFKKTAWFFDFQNLPEIEENPPVTLDKKVERVAELTSKNANYNKLVVFIGDSYGGEGEDLLAKMISAMKLSSDEFVRLPLDSKLEEVEDLKENRQNPNNETMDLFSKILELKPQVVVSLGATATNIMLGRREKLSTIHGQFLDQTLDSHHFKLMAIFHPDFLLINPNMKRTAWIDLQKVMECVGKIKPSL